MKLTQICICQALMLALLLAVGEARPPNGETNQDSTSLDMDIDEVSNAFNAYNDMPAQAIYPSIPMDRLQMLIAQYRPHAYVRTPAYGMNELFRMPETKRQVRYRQCYFNPISCFKK